jgi:isopentenyl-diphosphate Delta-isomerase
VEWLWLVDENDQPLGKVERAEAHQNLRTHRSGIVFLVDGRKRVYIAQRASTKSIFPGRYDSSASFHVAYEESYEQAAIRESVEELGLCGPLTEIGKFCHRDPPESQFVAVFVMEHLGERVTLDPDEASGGAFYTLAEAMRILREESCTPWLRDGLPIFAQWARWRS